MHKSIKCMAKACLATTLMTAPFATSLQASAVIQTQSVTAVKMMGQIKMTTAPIYKLAGDKTPFATAGSSYTNEIFYIRKKSVVAGTTYYEITRGATDATAAIGWVKANDLQTTTFSYPKNEAIDRTLTGVGAGYTRPGGLSRNVLLRSLAAYKGETFTPLSTAKVGKDTWYFGTIDGINTWLKAESVTKKEAPAEAVSYMASVKSAKTPIYKTPTDKKALMTAGSSYTNEIFYVYAKKMVGDTTYYEIKRKKEDAAIGWVKEKSLKLQTLKTVKNSTKTFYVKGTSKGYSRPAGGTRNVIYSTLKPYQQHIFKSTAKVKVGTKTWYAGKIGDTTVWVKSGAITTTAPTTEKPATPAQPETIVIVEAPTSMAASITNAKAVAIPDLKALDQTIPIEENTLQKTKLVTKKATIEDTVYYYFEKLGWVKASDTKAQVYEQETVLNEVRTLKGTGRGYNEAGSSMLAEAVLSTLAALANTDFTVTKSALVGGKLWYYGKTVNGVAMWTVASNTTVKATAKPVAPTYSTVNLQAEVKAGAVKLYADVENIAEYREMTAAQKVQAYTITKQAVTADGQIYYQLMYDGEVVGWVGADDVTTEKVSTKKASLFIVGIGKAYSEAGEKGTVVYDNLEKFRTEGFMTTTSKTVNNVVYYKGTLNNKTVWIAASLLANPYYVENLRKVSNVTAAEMESYLIKKKGTAITTNPLYKAIPAFLEMQKKYGINAQFMLAHSILETGWGKSEIFQYKNNGFGYQAYDSCAKTCALYFPTMNDSVSYYADAIYNKYLKEGAIYNNGTTPAGMNVKYASAKDWGYNIARLMNDMKAYDADYYDAQQPSTIEPAPISVTYDHIIPANLPQPETFHTLNATATVKAATKIYTLPVATAAREMASAKAGETLKVVAYHEDVKDPSTSSRWFRIDYNGQQAWVQSATLSIPTLASTTEQLTVFTNTETTAATLGKNTHLTLNVDDQGKIITKQQADQNIYVSIQIPNTTKSGWVKQTLLTYY